MRIIKVNADAISGRCVECGGPHPEIEFANKTKKTGQNHLLLVEFQQPTSTKALRIIICYGCVKTMGSKSFNAQFEPPVVIDSGDLKTRSRKRKKIKEER